MYGEPQISEPGGMGEERNELGYSDVFLTPLLTAVLGGERQGCCGFSADVNGKRSCELQSMGLLEKCIWSKCTRIPRGVVAASLYDDRIIKQALGKGRPGFANEGASDQQPTLFSTEGPLAGVSQDSVNDLQWENRNILRLGFLRSMKRSLSTVQ
jgi:hypothetical protein